MNNIKMKEVDGVGWLAKANHDTRDAILGGLLLIAFAAFMFLYVGSFLR